MQPKVPQQSEFLPVVKGPRREWRIPRIDAYARLLQEQQEEARLKALTEGTTPQGREILRKILYRTELRNSSFCEQRGGENQGLESGRRPRRWLILFANLSMANSNSRSNGQLE
jgi:hypothetical protein